MADEPKSRFSAASDEFRGKWEAATPEMLKRKVVHVDRSDAHQMVFRIADGRSFRFDSSTGETVEVSSPPLA